MTSDTTIDLDAHVSAALRRARLQRGQGQEDVARRARSQGLVWTRAAVANLENGKRRLTIGELFAVPLVYEVALQEILPQAGLVALGGTLVVEAPYLHHTFGSGKSTNAAHAGLAHRAGSEVDDVSTLASGDEEEDARSTALSAIEKGDAERWAARKLGVLPWELAEAALNAWGHGLTEERERRLAERDVSDQDRRIARGHVTRELLAELDDYRDIKE